MTDINNKCLISRSVFSGIFIYGGYSRFCSIVSKFNIFRADLARAEPLVSKFLIDLEERYHSIITALESFDGEVRDYDCIRSVHKVSSASHEKTDISPLGGRQLYVYDALSYGVYSRKLKEKKCISVGNYTFFRNYNSNALLKLQRFGRNMPGLGDHSKIR